MKTLLAFLTTVLLLSMYATAFSQGQGIPSVPGIPSSSRGPGMSSSFLDTLEQKSTGSMIDLDPNLVAIYLEKLDTYVSQLYGVRDPYLVDIDLRPRESVLRPDRSHPRFRAEETRATRRFKEVDDQVPRRIQLNMLRQRAPKTHARFTPSLDERKSLPPWGRGDMDPPQHELTRSDPQGAEAGLTPHLDDRRPLPPWGRGDMDPPQHELTRSDPQGAEAGLTPHLDDRRPLPPWGRGDMDPPQHELARSDPQGAEAGLTPHLDDRRPLPPWGRGDMDPPQHELAHPGPDASADTETTDNESMNDDIPPKKKEPKEPHLTSEERAIGIMAKSKSVLGELSYETKEHSKVNEDGTKERYVFSRVNIFGTYSQTMQIKEITNLDGSKVVEQIQTKKVKVIVPPFIYGEISSEERKTYGVPRPAPNDAGDKMVGEFSDRAPHMPGALSDSTSGMSRALSVMAPHMPAGLSDGTPGMSRALSVMAPHMPAGLLDSTSGMSRALSVMAPHMPAGLSDSTSGMSRALSVMAPHLPTGLSDSTSGMPRALSTTMPNRMSP